MEPKDMNTYLLVGYEDNEWAFFRVKELPLRVDFDDHMDRRFEVLKCLEFSENFNLIYASGSDVNGMYVPHIERDGKLYIHSRVCDADTHDRIFTFQTDDDALLFIEMHKDELSNNITDWEALL